MTENKFTKQVISCSYSMNVSSKMKIELKYVQQGSSLNYKVLYTSSMGIT